MDIKDLIIIMMKIQYNMEKNILLKNQLNYQNLQKFNHVRHSVISLYYFQMIE